MWTGTATLRPLRSRLRSARRSARGGFNRARSSAWLRSAPASPGPPPSGAGRGRRASGRVGEVQAAEDCFLFPPHVLFVRRALMVVAQQVHSPVHDKKGQLPLEGVAVGLGLLHRAWI